jgi:hypothetical protein
MKRLVLAIGILAFSGISAFATQVVWQGTIFVVAVSDAAACNTGGISVGSYFEIVFRPANIGTNGADTKLALHSPRSAFDFVWTGKPFGNGITDYTSIGGTANVFTTTQKFSKTSLKPAPLAATTETVEIKGTIANFLNTPGCTASLMGAAVNRPGL